MKFVKTLAVVALSLAALLIAGAYVALQLVDTKRIKELVETRVEAETGRELSIAGAVEPTLGLMPTVAMNDVTLTNAPWAKAPEMLAIKRLEVSLALLPLFHGSVEIAEITLQGATIHLETRGEQANWDLAAPAQDAQADAADQPEAPDQPAESGGDWRIDQLRVSDSVLEYTDHQAGETYRLDIARLQADELSAGAIGRLRLNGTFKEAQLQVSGTRSEPNLMQVEASLRHAGAQITARGNVALDDFTYDLTVEGEAQRLARLLALAGIASEDDNALTLRARLGGNPHIVSFSDLALTYGPHTVQGEGEVTLTGETPYLEASLTVPEIVIEAEEAPLEPLAEMPEKPAEEVASPVPETPIPTRELGFLNADITVTVGEVQTPHINLGSIEAKLALKNRRLRFDPLAVATSQGWVRGSAGLDAQTTPPTVQLDLLTNDIVLSALLMELAGESAIEGGVVKSDLSLQGKGATVREALAAASGHFNFYIDEAVYRTPAKLQETQSFVNILRGADDPPNEVHIACGVGRFNIAEGVAKSDLLAMKTAGAIVTGDGELILHNATMNMLLTARSGFVGLADAVPPLKLKGPIANPVVRLATGSAIVGIGKIVLGATTGVGLAAVLGEQVTDRLGITAETNPCLKEMAEMEAQAPKTPEEKAKQAEEKIKENVEAVEENVKQKRDKIKDNIKQLEDDTEAIRDNLRQLFKKQE